MEKTGTKNRMTLAKLSDKVDTLVNNLNAVTNNLDKLAKIVTDGFTEQAKFNTRIEKQVSDLRNDFNRVVKLNNLKH